MASIAFTGDIAFSKYMKTAYERDFIAPEVKAFLQGSDHVIANMESPVSRGDGGGKQFAHTTDPRAIPYLKDCGIDCWSLANNHTMDCGLEGIADTLRNAEENGIRTVGAGRTVEEADRYITFGEAGGIGVYSVVFDRESLRADTEKPGCIQLSDTQRIRRAIEAIKKECRWCVLIVHAGTEFSQMPLPYVRKRYHEFLKFGADVVVGHHPHVVQSYEKVGEKYIFYSLGNFIFDTDYQRNQRYTEYSVLLRLNFTETDYTFDFCPTKVDRENHTVVKTETPKIFRNVTPAMYRLVWPLACADYTVNHRKAIVFVRPEFADKPKKFFAARVKKTHGSAMAVRYMVDPVIAKVLPLWRLGDKDIIDYLR